MATEPTTWATLFDGDPITVKPRERKLSSLLKSYRYANANFGSAVSVMFAKYLEEYKDLGDALGEASDNAYARVIDEFFLGANEERVNDFLGEMPLSEQDRVRNTWFAMLRTAAGTYPRELFDGGVGGWWLFAQIGSDVFEGGSVSWRAK